jgi:hypothetical protein
VNMDSIKVYAKGCSLHPGQSFRLLITCLRPGQRLWGYWLNNHKAGRHINYPS